MTDDREPFGAVGGRYASPPCVLHELEAAQGGPLGDVDAEQARDVARWRKAERCRLLAARAAVSVDARASAATAIATHLDAVIGDVAGKTVSAYWPIKSELDLRNWLMSLTARGAVAVLPVVTEKAAPLRFRVWTQGVRMERGIWNIPVPSEGAWLNPDILIAPVVGYDAGCYRLGYGGGYFDRTLAARGTGVRALGVGLAASRIATIFPQSHDISMQAIVTEDGVNWPENP